MDKMASLNLIFSQSQPYRKHSYYELSKLWNKTIRIIILSLEKFEDILNKI